MYDPARSYGRDDARVMFDLHQDEIGPAARRDPATIRESRRSRGTADSISSTSSPLWQETLQSEKQAVPT